MSVRLWTLYSQRRYQPVDTEQTAISLGCVWCGHSSPGRALFYFWCKGSKWTFECDDCYQGLPVYTVDVDVVEVEQT